MSSRSMRATACVTCLRLSNTPLYVWTTSCLSIHLSRALGLPSTFWPLCVMSWTQAHKHLFASLVSILLGVHQEVELLDHSVILVLILWGTANIVSHSGCTIFKFPPAEHKGPNFSAASPTLVIFWVLILATQWMYHTSFMSGNFIFLYYVSYKVERIE